MFINLCEGKSVVVLTWKCVATSCQVVSTAAAHYLPQVPYVVAQNQLQGGRYSEAFLLTLYTLQVQSAPLPSIRRTELSTLLVKAIYVKCKYFFFLTRTDPPEN